MLAAPSLPPRAPARPPPAHPLASTPARSGQNRACPKLQAACPKLQIACPKLIGAWPKLECACPKWVRGQNGFVSKISINFGHACPKLALILDTHDECPKSTSILDTRVQNYQKVSKITFFACPNSGHALILDTVSKIWNLNVEHVSTKHSKIGMILAGPLFWPAPYFTLILLHDNFPFWPAT